MEIGCFPLIRIPWVVRLFKGASWALVLGLPLRDTIKGLLLVLGPFLIPTFGLVSWAYAPIISNPIKNI